MLTNKTFSIATFCALLLLQGCGGSDGPAVSQRTELPDLADSKSVASFQLTAAQEADKGDRYDAQTNRLSIPFVNVGVDTYRDVEVDVGSVLGVAGGRPQHRADSYDPASNELHIPSVRAYGQTYTNVKVNVGRVHRALGPLGADSVWTEQGGSRWSAEQLEGVVEGCRNRSIRWIAPITGFDVNRDGLPDFILPITCYLGADPAPGEQHNRHLQAAWKMFCSEAADGSYADCTQSRFGTPTIKATGTGSGGGNPYVHVMEQPFDINKDGYPDFWYALNRDDGRPGFNYDNPQDVKLLEAFCGPRLNSEWDCTRTSNQSVLLSRSDGTYQVAILPWGATNTQAMVMLPNLEGTFDAFSFNYGQWRAARLKGQAFVDVTAEYKSLKNIDKVGFSSPYVRVLNQDGLTYLVAAGVPREQVAPGILDKIEFWGFSLWKWVPGVGFELSDVHMPKTAEVFNFKQARGTSVVTGVGAYIRGVPVFYPRWHFFRYAKLKPDEEPVLVAMQESGTTAGQYFKAPVNAAAVYENYNYDSPDYRHKIVELSAVEGFYIRNGKLVPRAQSVIEGDVLWNAPDLQFDDLNGDGFQDAVRVSGHSQRGSVYLNNGEGTLRKINLQKVLPNIRQLTPSYNGNLGWTVRRLGSSTQPSLLWWGVGFNTLPDWAGPQYAIPDVGLMRGQLPMDVLPVHSPQKIQQDIGNCLAQMQWIDFCDFQ